MADLLARMDNLWFLLGLVEFLIFLFAAAYFRAKPEKATFLISSWSHLPKAERERYDLIGLSRYLSRIFIIIAVLCLIGGIASFFAAAVGYWIATILWIAVAVATLRVDNEKVLRKFRK